MKSTTKPKPSNMYKKTELTPAQRVFVREFSLSDNATKSARIAYPGLAEQTYPVKAHRLLRNDNVINAIEAQKAELEAISTRAVLRIGELVDSEKEPIALEASKFAIDHVHGKATQKMELKSQHVMLTIDLTGGEAGEVPQSVLDQLADKGLPEPQ